MSLWSRLQTSTKNTTEDRKKVSIESLLQKKNKMNVDFEDLSKKSER
jgi:hypothetical protein